MSTVILVPSTNIHISVGQTLTADEVKATYSAAVPGISQMDVETTREGETVTYTFRPRTGTKG
jgi:PRTRC genetic system protein C